jgi:hypothetical protein
MRMVALERHGYGRVRHRFHPAFSTLPGIVVSSRGCVRHIGRRSLM